MAINRLTHNGYGQIELNQVAFRRDGRIEAQCKLDPTITTYVENGMLLAIDKAGKKVGYPANDGTDKLIGLHYSAEHQYDERLVGLKDWKLDQGTFYPRMGFLATGDRFTTNTIQYNTSTYATESALKTAISGAATTAVYGGISTTGCIEILAAAPTYGPKLQVVGPDTMPDGQYAVKFVVIDA